MTFEEFWKENYEKEFGTSEPYYGIASYAFEKGQENCNCVYTDNSNVIQKLEAQIEKMKCCGNCEHFNFNEPNYCHKGLQRKTICLQ